MLLALTAAVRVAWWLLAAVLAEEVVGVWMTELSGARWGVWAG